MCWCARAHAQIVDVQSLIGREIHEGPSGKLEASLDWRTGNTRLLRVGGAVIGRYKSGEHLVFAILRGEYGRNAGIDMPLVTNVSKTFEHVRYRWRNDSVLAIEAFAQNEADRFRRLRVRALAGVGARIELATCTTYSVHAGIAYLVEYEQLFTDGLASSGASGVDHRLSTYVVATYSFGDRITASESIYVQPRIDDPRDVRTLEEAALISKLGDRFAFKTAFMLAHDSRPPPSTASLDTALQTSITVVF